RRIIAETAPLIGSAIKDDGPFIFFRNRVQAVAAGGKFLSIDQNIVSDDEGRSLIRARAPYVTPGHDRLALQPLVLIIQSGLAFCSRRHRCRSLRKDRPSLHSGAAVGDGQVRNADGLHHAGFLAGTWQTNLRRLLRGGELCCARQQEKGCEEQSVESFWINHEFSPRLWFDSIIYGSAATA